MSDAPDNVERLRITSRHDLDPEDVLRCALNEGLSEVVIVGFDKEGREYFASSLADGGDAVWHLNRGIYRLMRIADEIAATPKAPPPEDGGQILPFSKD